MRRTSGTHLRIGLAGALVLFSVACQDKSTPLATDAEQSHDPAAAGPEFYAAELTPLNNSGVSGAAAFVIDDGQFTARVYATGTVPNQLHPQHIHGLEGDQKSVCPAPNAADDIPNSPESAANPDELISVAEGAPAYGPVRVPLDGQLNATTEAPTFPTAGGDGIVNYLQKTSFSELQAEVEPFQLRPLDQLVVVLHGAMVTGPNGEQVYDASLPVACAQIRRTSQAELEGRPEENMLDLPAGFRAEKVVDGLIFPTSVTWDDQGRMYVAEAGGGLGPPRQIARSRILRVENGRATPVVDVTDEVQPSLIGLTWHNGAFFATHRAADDLTGTVSRVTLDGQVTEILTGIIDSQSEHQINDIVVGPDGRMYVTVGQAANAAVVGPDIAGFIALSPNVHSRPCRDLVLTGRNFKSADFRTEQEGDSVLTGAFVPFGTETSPGQVIPGVDKCGGAILVFDPDNAEATVRPFADGFRNLLGLAFDPQTGEMYVAENGYDIRGSRPVQDVLDGTFRVREGTWYGHANFSAGDEPLTDDRFEVPDSLQAQIFIDGQPIGKDLGFVIDLEASGLSAPDPSLLLGRHEWQSSPSFLGVAPASWGDLAGQVFVAEFGDLRPVTNPLREQPVGRRVVRVDPNTGEVVPFAGNRTPQPAEGQGLHRPFDVAFGPDGNMYIVDYGVVELDPTQMPPFIQKQGTGAIWRIVRTGQ